MAVNYIDPAAGKLGESFSKLTTAIGERLTEKQRREKALRENPAQMQALAQAYRQAVQAGMGPTFLDSIGVRQEFGPQIDAFRPDVKERTDTAMLTQGTPEAIVRADTGEANIRGDTAEGIIKRGLINMQLDNQVSEQIRTGRGINAELIQNLPEERANTEREQLGEASAQARFGRNLFLRRNAAGLDRLTVDSEVLQEQARQAGFALDAASTAAYKDYLDNLDPTSHEYAVALLGLRNPVQLAHIQFHEGMSFEDAMARNATTGSDLDKLAETIKVQGEYSKALESYRATITNDNLSGPEKQQLLVQHQDNLNSWRLIAEQLQSQGLIFPIDASLAAQTNKNRIDFISRRFQSQDMKDVFNLMATEYGNFSSVAGDPLERLKASSQFWGSLPQRDREQLETGWGEFLAETRAAQVAEGREIERRNAIERTRQQGGNVTNMREVYRPADLGAQLDKLVQKTREINAIAETRRQQGLNPFTGNSFPGPVQEFFNYGRENKPQQAGGPR